MNNPFDRFLSFWRLQIVGWLLYLVMMYVTFLTVAPEGTLLRLFEIKTIRTIIGFCLTCVMCSIYRRFGTNLSIQKAVLLVLGCSIIFGGVWTVSEMAANFLRNTNFVVNPARIPRGALDYGLTLTAWSALYFGIKYWRQWQQERENAFKASALANQAQLEMLRYQINPHFLFNSLNSIRASIDEDTVRAKQMVTQLAEFLRYSLLHNNAKEVALGEEIEAVRNYLAIEKTRFEDKLEVEFKIDERAEKLSVPCFLLNPLVENAVKHGLNGSQKPLKILVSAHLAEKQLLLEVANTGTLSKNSNGTKVGLKNVRERLEKLFHDNGSFELKEENGWVRAQIKIGTDEIKALIVDDERLARKELRSLLAQFSEIEIVGEAENVSQALRVIETETPQVIFLDIQLSGEMGFDLLEKVGAADFKTVFVTAFDAYAIRAFEVNALDYLLKPVNPDRLKRAIEKLLETDQPNRPDASPTRPLEYDDRLFLSLGGRSIFLKINTISHVLAAGDYSEVFTTGGQKYLVEKSLREWEARLPEKHFARIHRACIINLESVERVENWFNRSYQIYLQRQAEPLTVSRRYAAKLKEKFG